MGNCVANSKQQKYKCKEVVSQQDQKMFEDLKAQLTNEEFQQFLALYEYKMQTQPIYKNKKRSTTISTLASPCNEKQIQDFKLMLKKYRQEQQEEEQLEELLNYRFNPYLQSDFKESTLMQRRKQLLIQNKPRGRTSEHIIRKQKNLMVIEAQKLKRKSMNDCCSEEEQQQDILKQGQNLQLLPNFNNSSNLLVGAV